MNYLRLVLLVILNCISFLSFTQSSDVTITLIDRNSNEPLIGATVHLIELNKGNITDYNGVANFSDIDLGSYHFEFSYIGYQKLDTILDINKASFYKFYLTEAGEQFEEITISTTRSTRTIKNIPSRIEFIGGEELEEKAIMNAPNISMVLRESTGIQIQQTSLSSGNRSIKIQGLDGRYTQLLKDGFPLYGGFSGGLSIMQIPPLDLAQFEIIKGSSSTLYGGGAIAGLVNMVSKRPEEDPELNILISQTHTGGSTGNLFYSKREKNIGYTLYGAAHYNSPYNPDDDEFTNIPRTRTFSFNPKMFYYPSVNSTIWLGVNATWDERNGGDINVLKTGKDQDHTYFENNNSGRISTQFAYEVAFNRNQSIQFKNSVGYFNRKTTLPNYVFEGNETNSFTEVNYSKKGHNSDWILGINLYTNSFKENIELSPRDMRQITTGIFVNNTTNFSDNLILESGFRSDYSVDWGVFPLPRIALLWKANNKFSTRIGGGLGYKIPDLFTEEAATINFRNVGAIDPEILNAERSVGLNLDFNYTTAFTDKLSFSINQLFYNTTIKNALLLNESTFSIFEFSNAQDNIQSIGSETNMKFIYNDFRWFINYAYINTKLQYIPGSPQKSLTPKHNAGIVLMYENEKWRVGYEVYYTGHQNLSSNVKATDFTTMGLLVQRHFEWGSPYLNFENFTDVRQNRYSAEVSGTLQNPIFAELYAPTDGFVFTVGINIKPFGREECRDGCHAE